MVELRVLVGEEMLPILDAGVQKGKPGQVGSQGPGSSSVAAATTGPSVLFFSLLFGIWTIIRLSRSFYISHDITMCSVPRLFKVSSSATVPKARQTEQIQVSLLSNPRRDGNGMPSYLHTAQKPSQFTSANSPWSPVALLYYKG